MTNDVTKITIRTDLYRREYEIIADAIEESLCCPYLPQNGVDLLGDFWGDAGLGGFCCDRDQISVATIKASHRLLQHYWKAEKESIRFQGNLQYLKNFTVDCSSDAPDQEYRHFLRKVDGMRHAVASMQAPTIEPLEIKIFRTQGAEKLLAALQNCACQGELFANENIFSILNIHLSAIENFEELRKDSTDVIVILDEAEICDKKNISQFTKRLLFVTNSDSSLEEKIRVDEENSPAFWFLQNDERLVEILWLYLDFYYLRGNFKSI